MLSVWPGTTVRYGNHTLSAAEVAAGQSQRLPFVDDSDPPVPTDPDTVTLELKAPTGVVRTFAYPTAGPDDLGVLTKQEDGRFYVDWTPADAEDGLWTWELKGQMELGSGRSDAGAHFTERPIARASA